MKKTRLFIVLLALAAMQGVRAADDLPVRILQEIDTVWYCGYEGVNLYGRLMHRIDIAYPSVDPEGNPTELSGYVTIPADVYTGEQPCDGIVLYNHYTQLNKNAAPTRGWALGEDIMMANPLKPNYIVVSSDFYGFGITEDQDQWFCYGEANAQASIDCLFAAQQLLRERGIPQGRFLVNAGQSSGGYDAIAVQKLRDMKYRDQIHFDRTIVGGLPFDIVEAIKCFVRNKDREGQYFGLLIILDSYNTHAKLGYTPQQLLKPPFDEMFHEWMHSGHCTTDDIKKAINGKKLSEIVQDELFDPNSEIHQKLIQSMEAQQLRNNWVPDTTQNYTVTHLFSDPVVPVESDRALLHFLSDYEFNGKKSALFRRSIIPEQTHLNTNFLVNHDGHSTVSPLVFYLTASAILTTLPVLYYDGELNTYYADVVKDRSPMDIIRLLDAKGINLKRFVIDKIPGVNVVGLLGLIEILGSIGDYMDSGSIAPEAFYQMADDAGLTVAELLELISYLKIN